MGTTEKDKIINALTKTFKSNENKFFSNKDILKILGKEHDLWVASNTVYKCLGMLEERLKLEKRQEPTSSGKGMQYLYGFVSKTQKPNDIGKELPIDDRRFDQITSDIQKISITITALKSLLLDLPNRIALEITNRIGTQIDKNIKAELGEFFQDFVKDHAAIQENINKLFKQNGLIINTVQGFKAKTRLLGGVQNNAKKP